MQESRDQPPALASDVTSYLLLMLERMAESAGLKFDRLHWRRAIELSVDSHPGDASSLGPTWLAGIERTQSFRLQSVRLPVEEALGYASADAPIALPWKDADRPMVLVFRKASGRVRIWAGKDEWIDEGTLRDKVGTGPVQGVILEPLEAIPNRGDSAKTNDHDGAHTSPHRRLFALMRVESSDLWVVFIFAVVVGLFSIAVPISVEALVTTVMFGTLLQPLVVLSIALFAFLGTSAILRAAQLFVMEIVQRRIFVRVVDDLAFRLPRVQPDGLLHHYPPELVNRFLDTSSVQKQSTSIYLDAVTIAIQTVVGMIILAFYHPWLIGFDLFLLLMLLIAVFFAGRGAVRTSIDESIAKYETTAWFQDVVRCPNTFRHGSAADFAFDRADHHAKEYLTHRRAHFSLLFRQVASVLAIEAIASTVLLGMGGWLVIHGQLTLGQLVAAELIVTTITASFAKLGKQLEAYYDLMASLQKLGHLLDLPVERAGGTRLSATDRGVEVKIHGLKCPINDHDEVALQHAPITVGPGERLAVRGSAGSGKTLLLETLYGLRVPAGGYVQIDGHDLRDLRLDSLRDQSVLISQLEIFDGSVEDNIVVGRPEIRTEDVDRSLASVGLAEEIRRLPKGLKTHLTRGVGRPLSDSQLRRLMFARAIAGGPRLLLIDGLLDSLSPEQLHTIRAFFDTSRCTTFIATNRDEVASICSTTLWLDPKGEPAPPSMRGGST